MSRQQTSNQLTIQPKRKRGAQLGNKNALGNIGNRKARGKYGNTGGKGAPVGNRFACKTRTLASELAKDYAYCPEALKWLAAKESVLRTVEIRSDSALDRAMFLGLSIDL